MKDISLYLFTASYPFENTESFIDDELPILSQYFNKIEIVPLIGNLPQTRLVPKNVFVHTPIINSRRGQYIKGLFTFKTLPVFVKDFFVSKVFKNRKALKTWFIAYVQANNIVKSDCIRDVLKKINQDDICYFYWGKGCNMLSALYPNKAHYISRFHGEWDLWEESSGDYGPIRNQVANGLDSAVFISKKGKEYFERKYPSCKTMLFPLGSKDFGYGLKSKDTIVRVVSCSTVYPLKRVPLIFQSLLSLPDSVKIEWTHMGGGPDFDELKNLIATNKRKNISVSLKGDMSHDCVMDFFKNSPIDIFVNLSTNEGVPVSIMEAISFDIPVVATNVGATSEVVSNDVGVLVDSDPTPKDVATAIIGVLENKEKFTPRSYWETHYNATHNYNAFAQYLANL